jgi:hypothetical protein
MADAFAISSCTYLCRRAHYENIHARMALSACLLIEITHLFVLTCNTAAIEQHPSNGSHPERGQGMPCGVAKGQVIHADVVGASKVQDDAL